MPRTDPANSSLGALVAERPARAALFERLRLDYCCGGGQTLAEACLLRGLDPHTVGELIDALDDGPLDHGEPVEECDWRQAGIAELCDHIVAAHHDRLRTELPRIAELLATVVRVHGADHPELHDVERLFVTMRQDLESHIEQEEQVLFPACRAVERGEPLDGDAGAQLLEAFEHDHASTGDAIAALRELTNDFDTTRPFCGTHQRLLKSLRGFELDIHQHIHEENNLLFPRVRALAAADCAPASGGDHAGT
jgi:regulator of cell morphogenesis and NO signaling